MKRQKPRVPTIQQTILLRRLAVTGRLMLTHQEDGKDYYTDGAGAPVHMAQAKIVIREGWVTPDRDSMFDLTPQSWRVKTP